MKILTGIISEAIPPEFKVRVRELDQDYVLENVLFVAQGSQDSGTFYPSRDDLVLILSVTKDENYIISGIQQKPPRVFTYQALNAVDPTQPQIDVKLRESGNQFKSKDGINILAGTVRGQSCRLEVFNGKLNLIFTKEGDYLLRDGWKYYDIPFIRNENNKIDFDLGEAILGSPVIETGNEQLLASVWDALNFDNIEDIMGSAAIASFVSWASQFDFFDALPATIHAGVFHAHPIETIPFTPIRIVWRDQNETD